ncbi:class I adenylate-forming enzyme family protein [Cypionkella sp.]|uniref:AMP-binding protein n=1 Tax=Cypionkella sp. TaxID=2811411 RepID=UPI00262A9575|nr:class I adenylate-forming enzyme family protein [Cypionkella sp.]
MTDNVEPLGYYAALRTEFLANPSRIVVWRRDRAITAEKFMETASSMAGWLADQGFSAGDRLGLAMHDNLHSIQLAMACWMIDVEPMILDHRLGTDSLAFWRSQQKLRAVISRQVRVCAFSGVVLMPDPASLPKFELLTMPSASPANRVGDFIASSGVSGAPKVKEKTQVGMLTAVRAMMDDQSRGFWGAALSAISVAFPGARYIWWRNLLAGEPIHSIDLLFSTDTLDEALLDPRIQECTLPPNLIRALAAKAEAAASPLPRYPHLKKLQSIGGPARAEDKLRAYHSLTPSYLMTYSSTETGVISRIGGHDLLTNPDSCGRVLLGLDVDIADNTGATCPPDTVGRIRLRRPAASGKQGEITEIFPGDLGWFDDAGFLYIAARGEGIICRHGVNFSAALLESRILAMDSIRDAAVIRVSGREDTEDAILLALDIGTAPMDDIRRELRKTLNAHERPDGLWLLGPEDLTVGGKIKRSQISAWWQSAPEKFQAF